MNASLDWTDEALLQQLVPHVASLVADRMPLNFEAFGGYDEGPTLTMLAERLAVAVGLDDDATADLVERVHDVARARALSIMSRYWSDRFGSWSAHSALELPDGTVLYLYDDDADVRGLIVDMGRGPLDELQAHAVLVRWVRPLARVAADDPFLVWGNRVYTSLRLRSPMLTAALRGARKPIAVEDESYWQARPRQAARSRR